MNRICVPNANVFTNALKDALTTFYNASNTGTFGNFISDLSNVKIYKNIELAMAIGSFWICSRTFICMDVCSQMSCRLYCMDVYLWSHIRYRWYGCSLFIQLRKNFRYCLKLICWIPGSSYCNSKC